MEKISMDTINTKALNFQLWITTYFQHYMIYRLKPLGLRTIVDKEGIQLFERNENKLSHEGEFLHGNNRNLENLQDCFLFIQNIRKSTGLPNHRQLQYHIDHFYSSLYSYKSTLLALNKIHERTFFSVTGGSILPSNKLLISNIGNFIDKESNIGKLCLTRNNAIHASGNIYNKKIGELEQLHTLLIFDTETLPQLLAELADLGIRDNPNLTQLVVNDADKSIKLWAIKYQYKRIFQLERKEIIKIFSNIIEEAINIRNMVFSNFYDLGLMWDFSGRRINSIEEINLFVKYCIKLNIPST